jgi:hypothetical protein
MVKKMLTGRLMYIFLLLFLVGCIQNLDFNKDMLSSQIQTLYMIKEIENNGKYIDKNKISHGVSFLLQHDKLEQQIGYPAILIAGEELPGIHIYSTIDGILNISLVEDQTDKPIYELIDYPLGKVEALVLKPQEKLTKEGQYKIVIEVISDQASFFDQFYFTVSNTKQLAPAFLNEEGRMVYLTDYKGNRIPDFSHVGYMNGEVDIPIVPVKKVLEPQEGDDTKRIQLAIDELAALPLDQNGFRGAVLLKKGIYEINDSILINASGIVLKGEGSGNIRDMWLNPERQYSLESFKKAVENHDATILIATGNQRRALIRVIGSGPTRFISGSFNKILDNNVPVGSNRFRVENPELYQVGDKIIVQRVGNAFWINEIGMNRIPGENITQWQPFNLEFKHEIVAIDDAIITLKGTIMNAIETQWGGGRIYKYNDADVLQQVGVQNLRAVSFWQPNQDGVDDTRHADQFLFFDHIHNGWAKNIATEHFYSTTGAFQTGQNSLNITIEDASVLIAPPKYYSGKGYDASGRTFLETQVYVGRYGFHLVGQGALVRDAYALNNRHAFVVGARVPGPNVFLDSQAEGSLTFSEPHHRWSVGGLYDNVEDKIAIMNRLNLGTGHGWAGANYVAWNTRGTLVVHQPPTAQNWAIGHVGIKEDGYFPSLDGLWYALGNHVTPRSLYKQQLKERLIN